jgi:hypothetical protein
VLVILFYMAIYSIHVSCLGRRIKIQNRINKHFILIRVFPTYKIFQKQITIKNFVLVESDWLLFNPRLRNEMLMMHTTRQGF